MLRGGCGVVVVVVVDGGCGRGGYVCCVRALVGAAVGLLSLVCGVDLQ